MSWHGCSGGPANGTQINVEQVYSMDTRVLGLMGSRRSALFGGLPGLFHATPFPWLGSSAPRPLGKVMVLVELAVWVIRLPVQSLG